MHIENGQIVITMEEALVVVFAAAVDEDEKRELTPLEELASAVIGQKRDVLEKSWGEWAELLAKEQRQR